MAPLRAARVRVEARAKLNLGLVVGPKRPDGFHELATIFQSVSLADTLIATRRKRGFSLRVRHERASLTGRRLDPGRARVPAGGDNLVLRAARLFVERTGATCGADFQLVKRIPAGAGLGGGSADAAAAIRAMERLSGIGLSRARRMALAAELGSDVPFAMLGGTALGLGRGERLTRLRLARPFRALIVVPAWRVSTAAAFVQIEWTKFGLTRWRANLRSAHLLARGPVEPVRASRLGNVFEDVLGEKRRDFLRLRRELLAAGASDAHLSGSGSAIFGIIPPRESPYAVAGRLSGSEPLYAVKSERAGMRLVVLP